MNPLWNKIFQNQHLYLQYTHSSALFFLIYRENCSNKIKQAGNQKEMYNLQGLQKWKSKQSITISNKYDIYLHDIA